MAEEDPFVLYLRELKKVVDLLKKGEAVELSTEELLKLKNQVQGLEEQVKTYLQESDKLFGLHTIEPGRRRELRDTIPEKASDHVKESLQKAMSLRKELEELRKKNWENLPLDQYPPGFLPGREGKKQVITEEEKKKNLQKFKHRKDWKPM